MAKRKGKNPLIDSIAAQTADRQEPTELSSISSNCEQLECKSQYETLIDDSDSTLSDLNLDMAEAAEAIETCMSPEFNAELARLQNIEAEASELSSANLKLVSENAALQEENDNYLMKISELTFENAKLNAQLQELSKNIAANQNSSQNNAKSSMKFNESEIPNSLEAARKNQVPKHARNVNYPYQPNANNSGYTSWN